MGNCENEAPVESSLPEQQQIMPPSATTLSSELQKIWDEIGGSSNSRDKMLLKLEQECLGLYYKKVEESRKYRAELQRLLADAEAEISSLMSALGEQVSFSRKEGSLTDQIYTVKTVLDDLLMKKDIRRKEIFKTLKEIAEISSNADGDDNHDSSGLEYDESDLTQTKLDELRAHLHRLCYEKVQGYVSTMHKMWKQVGTPMEERRRFNHISSLRSVKADDALKKGFLGLEIFREAQEEVKRLNALKTSKMRMSEPKLKLIICREVDSGAEQPLVLRKYVQRWHMKKSSRVVRVGQS